MTASPVMGGDTCDCYFNGDHTKKNRCVGVFCANDDQCESNKCLDSFCADPLDLTLNCNKDSTAVCGKCPGLKCLKPVEQTPYYKYQCKFGCGTTDGIDYKCTDCTCDFDNVKHSLCAGKYCQNDT